MACADRVAVVEALVALVAALVDSSMHSSARAQDLDLRVLVDPVALDPVALVKVVLVDVDLEALGVCVADLVVAA